MNYPEELSNTYEIYEEIGSGGGGIVYRAMHKRLQKMVVLKKIKNSSTGILKNRTEVDILKNLRHSYLPQVLDFIESSEGVFTVMDFIPGKSLQKMLEEGHVFQEKEVLKYAKQLCEALEYLHSQNPPIIHGDIKPDNIMITPEDNVCLIDFNISGMFEGEGMKTFGYTPGYSSPEQEEAFQAARELFQKQNQAQNGRSMQASQQAGGAVGAAGNGASERTVLLGADVASEDRKTVLLDTDVASEDRKTVLLGMDTASEDRETMLLAAAQEESEKTVLLGMDAVSEGGNTMLLNSSIPQEDNGRTLLLQEAQQEEGHSETMLSRDVLEKDPAGKQVMEKSTAVDFRSDIYSLAATLYTLLTGKLAIPNGEVDLPAISEGLAAILEKALAYQPGKRFASVAKMRQAFLQVHKKDRSYRWMVLRQNLTILLLMLMMAASVVSIIEGKQKMGDEEKEYYQSLVGQMEDGIKSGLSVEEFEKIYTEAIGLYPEDIQAYYAKANYLYENAEPSDVIPYIEGVLSQQLEDVAGELANLNYLCAECYFQGEDYVNARKYYEDSIRKNPDNPEIYRDYAISLVYLGEMGLAEEVLASAVYAGMQQADIYMVQGEIEHMLGNTDKALECFGKVLEETEEEYLRQRAYLMSSKVCRELGTEEALQADAERLEEAVGKLSTASRLLIYQALVQDCISLGEITQENRWYEQAIHALEEINANHWGTYLTYSNIIVLCQRIENLELAATWGEKMLQDYPERYVTYMRLAFLEVELQRRKENADRDYTKFAEYYQTAEEYAGKQLSGNVTDAEMLLLREYYQQIRDGGWLK